MEARIINAQPIHELSARTRHVLIESGLWLRIGFIGASGLAAGILQLFGGEVRPLSTLALVVGGGVLATLSWRRAGAVLESADKSTAIAPTSGHDRALAGA